MGGANEEWREHHRRGWRARGQVAESPPTGRLRQWHRMQRPDVSQPSGKALLQGLAQFVRALIHWGAPAALLRCEHAIEVAQDAEDPGSALLQRCALSGSTRAAAVC